MGSMKRALAIAAMIGLGACARGAAAPADDGFSVSRQDVTVALPVKVANVAADWAAPVPTVAQGTTNVAGTVTANAQQSGAWNVGISGTPNVNVTAMPAMNISSLPPVTLAPGATLPTHIGRKPSDMIELRPINGDSGGFTYNASSVGINGVEDRSLFLVPQGKVLVITDFAAVTLGQSANTLYRFDLNEDWFVDANSYTGRIRYSIALETNAAGSGAASVHFTAGIVIPSGRFVNLYYPFSNTDLFALGYLTDAQ